MRGLPQEEFPRPERAGKHRVRGVPVFDEGNLVSAGQQTGFVSIAQLRPITVVFAEPQEHVLRINEELAAGSPQVTVMAAEGHSLPPDDCLSATIRPISPLGQSGSRLSSTTKTSALARVAGNNWIAARSE
jgi:hypothetical protein